MISMIWCSRDDDLAIHIHNHSSKTKSNHNDWLITNVNSTISMKRNQTTKEGKRRGKSNCVLFCLFRVCIHLCIASLDVYACGCLIYTLCILSTKTFSEIKNSICNQLFFKSQRQFDCYKLLSTKTWVHQYMTRVIYSDILFWKLFRWQYTKCIN